MTISPQVRHISTYQSMGCFTSHLLYIHTVQYSKQQITAKLTQLAQLRTGSRTHLSIA